jgi:hypothetical protein
MPDRFGPAVHGGSPSSTLDMKKAAQGAASG